MKEGPIDVYLRHRSELLKAIYDGTDPEQEVGDYLISTINLENHEIEFHPTSEDELCRGFSSDFLKAEEGGRSQPFASWRPAFHMEMGTRHPWRGRVKMAYDESDNDRFNFPLFTEKRKGETHSQFMERNKIPISMKHGLWPEVLPSRTRPVREKIVGKDGIERLVETGVETEPIENYTDVSPFDKKVHPLRRIRADTGKPEWEQMLREFYLGKNKWAEKVADAEKKHRAHWKKDAIGDGSEEYDTQTIYDSIPDGKFSFLGGDDGHKSEVTNHLHGLRLRDFERWKNGTGDWGGFNEEDGEKHKDRVKALDKEGKDLEEEHFNDRMEKLLSNDVTPITYKPEDPYGEWDKKGIESLADMTKVHAHGMGHSTLMRGLEFLSPEDRTIVMEHIATHGTDDPDLRHQYIELDDGHRLFMARIKQTKKQRQEGELHWFQRARMHSGANVPEHKEKPHDSFIHGDEGMIAGTLANTLVKDDGIHEGEPHQYARHASGEIDMDKEPKKMYDKTTLEHVMEKLEEAYEGDGLLEYGEDRVDAGGLPIGKAKNLPKFSERDIEDIQSALSEGKDAKEALSEKLTNNSHIALGTEGFLDLMGWNRDLTERHKSHPLFSGRGSKALINKSIMRGILKNLKRVSGLSLSAKQIRSAMGAHIVNHGPKPEDISDEEREHYLDVEGRLKGLGFPQGGRIFAHRGGLGRELSTYVEMMHDFHADDIDWDKGEGISSELGDREQEGSGKIIPNSNTLGLWARAHPHFLPYGQNYHDTAHGIMATTDTNTHALHRIGTARHPGRNIKTNSSQYLSTRSPYFMARFMRENPSPQNFVMETKNLTTRSIMAHHFNSHNFATMTNTAKEWKEPPSKYKKDTDGELVLDKDGEPILSNRKGWTDEELARRVQPGDYGIRRVAALARLQAHANGRRNAFGNPGERMHITLKDLEDNPSFRASPDMDSMDYLAEMPHFKGSNIQDRLDAGLLDELEDFNVILDEMKSRNPPEELPADHPIMRRYENLMAKFNKVYGDEIIRTSRGAYGGRQKQTSYGWRDKDEDVMRGDKKAVTNYARDVLIPEVLKAHPSAYHPSNPKALANVAATLQGAMRSIYKKGGGGLTTSAAWIRPAGSKAALYAPEYKKDADGELILDKDGEPILTKRISSDEQYRLASLMQQGEVGSKIIGDESIHMILKKLGLPDDTPHRKHVKHMMKTHGGDFTAATLGQLATAGIDWQSNYEKDERGKYVLDKDGRKIPAASPFKSLKGEDIHTFLDDKMKELQESYPTSAATGRESTEYQVTQRALRSAWDKTHKGHIALRGIRNVVNLQPDLLKGYGLTFQSSPNYSRKNPMIAQQKVSGEPLGDRELLFSHRDKTGDRRDLTDMKNIANSILVFDEGALQGETLQAKFDPFEGKKAVGWYDDVPIESHDSGEGAIPHDHYISGGMDDGYLVTPEIGIEHDEDDNIVVGTNATEGYYHTVPFQTLQMMFPHYNNEHIQTLIDSHPVEETTLSNQQTPSSDTGYPPSADFPSVRYSEPMHISNLLLKDKAELPKQVPLIDPLHRIFDIEDLKQLRGFTGEWVVSIHKDGKRCKVQCKKNRVTVFDDSGNKQSMSEKMRNAFKQIGKKDYVIDGVMQDGEFHVNDILLYDDDVVYDLSTRERIKVLRGQFDSYDPVYIPSPSDIRITDEVGLENAVKELSKESDKILLRDAKSTYMKGEEKHPKWVLLAKSDIEFHIPFSMEIDDSHFIIHLPEDLVKYEIVDGEAIEPIAAIGSLTDSDYSLRLAKSLEPYWKIALSEMLKEETEIEPEIDEERIEEESAGILKPKKDKNLIMKPNDVYKTLVLIERAIDAMEKGFSNLAGRGFGYDVGDGTESPRGPTKLDSEESLPDWDMRKRPTEDMEKPEDYPGRRRKAKKNAEQSNELGERSLEG